VLASTAIWEEGNFLDIAGTLACCCEYSRISCCREGVSRGTDRGCRRWDVFLKIDRGRGALTRPAELFEGLGVVSFL
jgi:hypothetical protein